MGEEYKIVPVTMDMIDGLEIIERTCFTCPWSRAGLESEALSSVGCWLAAVRGDEVCAFIGARVIFDEAEIINIAVMPAHRRKGLARRLIDTFFSMHPQLAQVFLEVRQTNIPAQTLYESIGFKAYSIRKNYYENPVEDAILMRYASEER